jgi:hypothetical protein
MISVVILLCCFSLLVIIGYYFYYFEKLIGLFKEKYPDDYQKLESPTLFSNSTPRNNFLLFKYLIKGEYKCHGNSEFTEICQNVIAFLLLGNFVFILLVAFFVYDSTI